MGNRQQDEGYCSFAYSALAYLITVVRYRNGVGYGKWMHFDGWSEAVIEYIRALEQTAW